MKLLGKRIRERRVKRGLTQDAMEGPGLCYKHYQDIERGVVNPAYLTLKSVAKKLACSVKELIPAYGGRGGKRR